jgi:hypothetical protein
MPIKKQYIHPLTLRAKELRDREKILHKNKQINDNVFKILLVENEKSNDNIPVGYYDNKNHDENNIPIADKINNNLVENVIPYEESKKSLLSYFFTPKIIPIVPRDEVTSIPSIYKSNFNAGKSKKKSKNKNIKKTRKIKKIKKSTKI